jgi:outer membrane cobalamin receptor
MSTYLRATGAIATVLMLAACAAPTTAVKPKAAAPDALAQNPGCLTQTGSRITRSGEKCTANGRSYSSDDIDRTGATTVAEALRTLDPSITIHH